MRVIGGTYRSRRLIAPRGLATRPTSDRLRETLFNVLAPRIEGAVFADLYAGSGAVGIEALSRGASLVYFVDHAPPAVAAIRGNLASLEIRSRFQIESSSVSAALRRLSHRARSPAQSSFWIRPMRPPATMPALSLALARRHDSLLTPSGIVVAEHGRKLPLAESYGALRRYRVLEQGDGGLSFYSR